MIKDSEFDTFILNQMAEGSRTIDFPCLRCGVCCSSFQVLLDSEEVEMVARKLGISRNDFLERYSDPRWGGEHSILVRHQDGACIFLVREEENNLTRCIINSFKPKDCEAWKPHPDKPECRKGRRKTAPPSPKC